MQPDNQYQPQPQYPSDYLDSIAAQPQVKTMNPMILWGLIGGLLLLVIIVFIAISSAGNNTSSSSLTGVAIQMQNLKTVTESSQKNIKSSELRTVNSSLTLALTNSNRDLAGPIAASDIKLKDKKNKTIAASAASTAELQQRLEDARLNAIFDRTYARELTFALKTLRSDMAVLYKSSRSSELKTALETADSNLKPIEQTFEAFNGS